MENPLIIVSVDGDYKYLGRLVVSFDSDGYIQLESVDPNVSGAYASTKNVVRKSVDLLIPEWLKFEMRLKV